MRPRKTPLQPDAHTVDVLSGMLAGTGCTLAAEPFAEDRLTPPRGFFTVRLHARSASLHPVETGWTLPRSTLRGNGDERCDALHRAAARQLQIQRRRHDDATALGMPIDLPMAHDTAIPVGHLLMDASVVAIKAGGPDDLDLVQAVRNLLSIGHSAPERQQSHALGIGATTVEERGSRRTVVMPIWIPAPRHDAVVCMDGRTLRIPGMTMPVTAISAMPGRRFGDLVSLHPALDDRRVETVANHDSHLEIVLRKHDIHLDGETSPYA